MIAKLKWTLGTAPQNTHTYTHTHTHARTHTHTHTKHCTQNARTIGLGRKVAEATVKGWALINFTSQIFALDSAVVKH